MFVCSFVGRSSCTKEKWLSVHTFARNSRSRSLRARFRCPTFHPITYREKQALSQWYENRSVNTELWFLLASDLGSQLPFSFTLRRHPCGSRCAAKHLREMTSRLTEWIKQTCFSEHSQSLSSRFLGCIKMHADFESLKTILGFRFKQWQRFRRVRAELHSFGAAFAFRRVIHSLGNRMKGISCIN